MHCLNFSGAVGTFTFSSSSRRDEPGDRFPYTITSYSGDATPNDFVGFAALSPDKHQLIWVEWQHPCMPWDSSQLWWCLLDASGLYPRGPTDLGANGHGANGSGDQRIWGQRIYGPTDLGANYKKHFLYSISIHRRNSVKSMYSIVHFASAKI